MRFAYTNGIARPDFPAILPKTYFIQDYNSLETGNSQLKFIKVQNFDLGISYEIYLTELDKNFVPISTDSLIINGDILYLLTFDNQNISPNCFLR